MKMKNKLLILSLVTVSFNVTAQPFSYDWHQNIPSTPQYRTPSYEFSETRGDTLYILGKSVTDSLDADPSGATDWIYDQHLTSVSNIVVISKYLISDGSYHGSYKLMEKPGTTSSAIRVRDFALDNSGNFIIVGRTSQGVDFDPTIDSAAWYSTETNGSFIAFYNIDGTYNAHIEYETELSGWNTVSSFSIKTANVDEQNNLYVSGTLFGTMDLDFTAGQDSLTSIGETDACVVKIDLDNQSYEWGVSFGGTEDDDFQYATLSSENIVLYGFFDSPVIDLDPGSGTDNHTIIGSDDCTFINEIDPNGNQVKGIITNAYYGYNITSDDEGSIYLLGQADDGTITDLDPSSGTYFVNTDNNSTYYISKYDTDLNFIWARSFSGPYGPDLRSIAVNSTYVSVAGNCYQDLYLSNEAQVDTLSSPINSEFFITNLNRNSGNLIKHISFPFSWSNNQSADSFTQCATVDDGILTIGEFRNALDFNPFDGLTNNDTTPNISGNYEYHRFILKLNYDGFLSSEKLDQNLNNLLVYPIPSSQSISLQSDNNLKEVSILDMKGRLILMQKVHSKTTINIDISDIENGTYLIKTTDINGLLTISKIIKN